jgi:hypothetical protein
MYIIHDRILAENEQKLAFEFEGKTIEALVGPGQVLVDGVGMYDGHATLIQNPTQHVCGLSGYGYGLDDRCEGCEESTEHSQMMNALRKHLREIGLLEMYRI